MRFINLTKFIQLMLNSVLFIAHLSGHTAELISFAGTDSTVPARAATKDYYSVEYLLD